MPHLSEITYSRDATIAAVRSYYTFLTQFYLSPSKVIEPPPGGWPSISTDKHESFGKTKEVVELLRHLPYISTADYENRAQALPYCYFYDYNNDFEECLDVDPWERCASEGMAAEFLPPHIVGLSCGGRDNTILLLDTKLGTVTWVDPPTRIHRRPSREPIFEDIYDDVPNDNDWHNNLVSWPIADFFEILKDQFRVLSYLPINERILLEAQTVFLPEDEGVIGMLQGVYRKHGWPDLDVYNKEKCLKAVTKALEKHYPDMVDYS